MNSAGKTPEQQVEEALALHGRPSWVAYVPMNTIRQVDKARLEEMITTIGKVPAKRVATKYELMERWCVMNVGAEISAYSLAEDFDMSPPTTRKFINERVDLFRKIRAGVWLVRDREKDRAEDRNLDTPLSDT
jgi:hypothetical protein